MSKSTYRIKYKGGYFVDDVRESPVDEYQVKVRRAVLVVVVVAAICVSLYLISAVTILSAK
jgi:hypothetical protein